MGGNSRGKSGDEMLDVLAGVGRDRCCSFHVLFEGCETRRESLVLANAEFNQTFLTGDARNLGEEESLFGRVLIITFCQLSFRYYDREEKEG